MRYSDVTRLVFVDIDRGGQGLYVSTKKHIIENHLWCCNKPSRPDMLQKPAWVDKG